jgi:hypothetical protein
MLELFLIFFWCLRVRTSVANIRSRILEVNLSLSPTLSLFDTNICDSRSLPVFDANLSEDHCHARTHHLDALCVFIHIRREREVMCLSSAGASS